MSRTGDNIYYRKDGRYEGRYIDGIRPGGNPKYHSVYGKSYDEVKAKMDLAIGNIRLTFVKSELTVNLLFNEWLHSISSRVKASTISNYRMKFKKHISQTFGEIPCCNLTSMQVYEFIDSKIKSGLSARYVSDIVVLMKSMFKYASAERKIFNPLQNLRLPKKAPTDTVLLSNKQQSTLQKYIRFNLDKSALGVALSLYTGIRIGELCALKWSDIDLKKRTLTVSKTIQRISEANGEARTKLVITEPKSISSNRTIPLPDCIITLLNSFSGKENSFVLSGTAKPIEPRTMQYRFKCILKKANLPSVNFHALRHMFATNCISLGFDVKSLSELLGHSSVEITLNRYVHSSIEKKREYMQRLSFAS